MYRSVREDFFTSSRNSGATRGGCIVETGRVDILETFSNYLHAADSNLPATCVLARWLWERLSIPPETVADKVLHCEISLSKGKPRANSGLRLAAGPDGPYYVFKPNSSSGEKLLESFYQYALSYEQQKWARWVHGVKASDFNHKYKKSL